MRKLSAGNCFCFVLRSSVTIKTIKPQQQTTTATWLFLTTSSYTMSDKTLDERTTAILTEHLEFAPLTLIDDVINAVNEIMYKGNNSY